MFNDRYGLTRAVLEGRKTMTRRIIKDENGLYTDIRCMKFSHINDKGQAVMRSAIGFATLRPAYHPGEVVAVAQNYKDICHGLSDREASWFLDTLHQRYDDKCALDLPAWRNKEFVLADLMPHRIRITDVRVERLQDISDEDCKKEGLEFRAGWNYHSHRGAYDTPREAFAALIDKVSGKGTWGSNPWVFVYEFELVKED